jgi:hypothetical protein
VKSFKFLRLILNFSDFLIKMFSEIFLNFVEGFKKFFKLSKSFFEALKELLF